MLTRHKQDHGPRPPFLVGPKVWRFGFTPVILVWIELKSLKVLDQPLRCESTLRACMTFIWCLCDIYLVGIVKLNQSYDD